MEFAHRVWSWLRREALARDLQEEMQLHLELKLQDQIARESREERSLARFLAGFGALAFGLAILGLYGTVAYSVSQRMRELAIRFALGATRRGVLWMIMSEAMRYVFLGILLGWTLAGGASRAVESFLFEVRGFDSVTCTWSIGLMAFAALLAAYVSARRARMVEPMAVLRSE